MPLSVDISSLFVLTNVGNVKYANCPASGALMTILSCPPVTKTKSCCVKNAVLLAPRP